MARAEKTGATFEDKVECAIREAGFTDDESDKVLIRNAPYDGILSYIREQYGIKHSAKNRTEFLLKQGEYKVRVECKVQNSNGTAFQKIMWSIADLQKCSEDKVILLVDGEKITDEIRMLLLDLCEGIRWKGQTYKVRPIDLMDFKEFKNWLNSSFKN